MSRYGVREVYAVDDILDLKYLDTFLAELAGRPRPPQLFYETKANLTKPQLRRLARAGVWGIQPGIESLDTQILQLMDKGVTALNNVRLLKWCAEIGLVPEWNFLYGFPGENPAAYASMARLVPSLTHLHPPGGPGRIRLDRFSPYFTAPVVNGIINVRASIAYRHIYPFEPADLDRMAYYFDYDYADGRDPDQYAAALKEEIDRWRLHHPAARLELRVADDRLEIQDTRPAAVRRTTILQGPARLAYLALDAGKTVDALRAELRDRQAVPHTEQIQEWLDEWQRARLVMREGPRYLSLATNFAERVQLPVERFLAALAGSDVGAGPQSLLLLPNVCLCEEVRVALESLCRVARGREPGLRCRKFAGLHALVLHQEHVAVSGREARQKTLSESNVHLDEGVEQRFGSVGTHDSLLLPRARRVSVVSRGICCHRSSQEWKADSVTLLVRRFDSLCQGAFDI